MKTFFKLSMLAVVLLATACSKKFDEYTVNPNSPEKVPAALALNGVENSMNLEEPWGQEQRWNQFANSNYNYYGNQEYNWGGADLNYTTLKNVVKMEEEALRAGGNEVNPYSALGKFFRAWFFYEMTMKVGDLPMSEALQGTDNLTPRYDTQKDIFIQILKWLETANTELVQLATTGDNTLQGDFYYNNDLKKWRKAVNTFHLRVLITLSKKENDADLKVKQDFAKIISDKTNYILMEDMIDNLQFVYVDPFNKYPTSPDNFGFDATRYNLASTHLGLLTSLKDPRTFVVAEPAGSKLKSGLTASDFNAYVGASSAEDLADMSSKAGVDNGPGYSPGQYSFYGRKRYYSNYTAEPGILLGYPEMCFNIAEGINRGWSTGDAEDWYKKGMMASIGFYGIKEGANTYYYLKPGGRVRESGDYFTHSINFSFDAYYNQPLVKYAGNNAAGVEQIIKQKYLAFFNNSGFQAYYNFRRTGLPVFAQGGPGTGNSGRIPKRFQYPGTERTTNGVNLAEALARQFGGSDDINAEMWVIK